MYGCDGDSGGILSLWWWFTSCWQISAVSLVWGLLICALWICSPHHFIPFVPLSTSPFIFIWMLDSIKVISKMCFTVISGSNVAKWVILSWYFVQCPHIHNPASLTWHPSADHLLPHLFIYFFPQNGSPSNNDIIVQAGHQKQCRSNDSNTELCSHPTQHHAVLLCLYFKHQT